MFALPALRIRPKLLLAFLLCGLIPLTLAAWLISHLATRALLNNSSSQLLTLQNIRQAAMEDFFLHTSTTVRTLAESEQTHNLLVALKMYQENELRIGLSSPDFHSPLYSSLVASSKKQLEQVLFRHAFQDLYLVDGASGLVLFSVSSSRELGANLASGRLEQSGLAKAWRQAKTAQSTVIIDFSPHENTSAAQAAFVAHPVRSEDRGLLGVLVCQLPPQAVTNALHPRQGMGKSGESYLISYQPKQERFEFRSDMTTMGNNAYVVGYSLSTPPAYWQDAVKRGPAGGSGLYRDSDGNEVLVAYNQLHHSDLRWYLISKIDTHEITFPIRDMQRKLALAGLLLLGLLALLAFFFSRGLTRPIIADVQFAKAIAAGTLEVSLQTGRKDELGDLDRALNDMASNLRQLNWQQSGKERLNDLLRGEHASHDLAQKCLDFLVDYLQASLGGLYLYRNNRYELAASYALLHDERTASYAYGEGLVGDAARRRQILNCHDFPEDTPVFHCGASSFSPACCLAIPISFHDNAIGVVLLAFAQQVPSQHRHFIEQNVASLGVLFHAAKSREKIKQLLITAETQQKELNLTNEELAEQTRALQQSERELQQGQGELRRINHELETRTQALEQQQQELQAKNLQLVKAQEIVQQKAADLEQANRYKSEFLANMSHELRTPLNSILILSQLLSTNSDGNLTPKQQESAATIHTSGSSLLQLINEILDLSKIEAGRVDLLVEEVPLEGILSDLHRLFKDIAASKGIALHCSLDEMLPLCIRTDQQRLQQILANLLNNACKFTEKGQVSLHIGRPAPHLLGEQALISPNAIAFAVSDQGIGIPAEQHQAVFEAFRQADSGTSRKYGGTGLGLSISKELARLLGGFIHLHSQPGQGSTFTLIIPECLSETPMSSDAEADRVPDTVLPVSSIPPADSQPPPELPPALFRQPHAHHHTHLPADDRHQLTAEGMRLLIIEDDPISAQIMRDFARKFQFQCLLAESGEQGLLMARHYLPQAILLNLHLPGMDGWATLHELQKDPLLAHIPVHFMSAVDQTSEALRLGAVGYLTKPVTLAKIESAFACLSEAISRKQWRLLVLARPAMQKELQTQLDAADLLMDLTDSIPEALALAGQQQYDCLLFAPESPTLPLPETWQQLAESQSYPHTLPVLIISRQALPQQEAHALLHPGLISRVAIGPDNLQGQLSILLHRRQGITSVAEELDRTEAASAQPDQPSTPPPPAFFHHRTVLLVDDDMRNAFALSSILEEAGVTVMIARDGIECLDKLERNNQIDAVLLDIMMPRMDGYQAMQLIRQEQRYALLPIIALTAKAMKDDRDKCLRAGANDYLAKPVTAEKLLEKLAEWI